MIPRQLVEQRRLARVRVADERHRGYIRLVPALAELSAPAADDVDLASEAADAMADPAAVGLELRFTRSAGADAAAQPRQRRAGADEARQKVLQLCELDLQLAFARPRAP